jgi:hypothetical protein
MAGHSTLFSHFLGNSEAALHKSFNIAYQTGNHAHTAEYDSLMRFLRAKRHARPYGYGCRSLYRECPNNTEL